MTTGPSATRDDQHEPSGWQHQGVEQPRDTVSDEGLWELIEDYVLTEVLRERLTEEPEPWDEMNEA